MIRYAGVCLILLMGLLSGCDEGSSYPTGGGPGGGDPSPSPNSSADSGSALSQSIASNAGSSGFGSPSDPSLLGNPIVTTSGLAKIDTDGDSAFSGSDQTWNAATSGTVDGQYVNSGEYAYVVVSQEQEQAGVQLGDWALVTNGATGQQVWARVEDVGPSGGQNEISVAAANAVGIQVQSNSNTVGNPSVTVQFYGSKQ
jgi:hypothetical protein